MFMSVFVFGFFSGVLMFCVGTKCVCWQCVNVEKNGISL